MVREATAADARGIAEVHVRCWQAAFGGILPKQLLDDLSVDLREDFWRAELGDEGSRARTLVAEDPPATLAGFITKWGDATLWIFQRNAQGRAFYARSGFWLDGTMSKHDPSGVTTARMRVPSGALEGRP